MCAIGNIQLYGFIPCVETNVQSLWCAVPISNMRTQGWSRSRGIKCINELMIQNMKIYRSRRVFSVLIQLVIMECVGLSNQFAGRCISHEFKRSHALLQSPVWHHNDSTILPGIFSIWWQVEKTCLTSGRVATSAGSAFSGNLYIPMKRSQHVFRMCIRNISRTCEGNA